MLQLCAQAGIASWTTRQSEGTDFSFSLRVSTRSSPGNGVSVGTSITAVDAEVDAVAGVDVVGGG